MGNVPTISMTKWPKQGPHLGKRVIVWFHNDRRSTIRGTVVRDDAVEPHRTIISLDQGRGVVLADECQYQVWAE